jgi:hypothetical protein
MIFKILYIFILFHLFKGYQKITFRSLIIIWDIAKFPDSNYRPYHFENTDEETISS